MILACDRSQTRHYGDEHGRYYSVSQVCHVLTGENYRGDETAMQRGTDLHQIFTLMLSASQGWCAPPEYPEMYAGYACALRDWIAKANPKPTRLERAMKHAKLHYAGTPDFVGLFGHAYGVLDLKTGTPARWHAVQVLAYRKLLHGDASTWLLYIRDDGTYTMKTVKQNQRDWTAFQNALSVLTWREAA